MDKARLLVFSMFILLPFKRLLAQGFEVSSPNQRNKVVVDVSRVISFKLIVAEDTVISSSRIGLNTKEHGFLGTNEEVISHNVDEVNNIIYPEIHEKRAQIQDRYNELAINFKKKFSLYFRVYDNGASYRISTAFKRDLTVIDERAIFHFSKNYSAYIPHFTEEHEKGFITHAENTYRYRKLDSFTTDEIALLPLLVETDKNTKVLFTEADLIDYPGMYVRGNSKTSLIGVNPRVVKKETFYLDEKRWERNPVILERENYIAKTSGSRAFPWRVFAIAEKDSDLIDNQLVYQLSTPNQIKDPSWIKPGQVSWDWWNNNNVYGVDFRAGINTTTYKYYIDFAAKNGLDYVILDEGWYELGNLMDVVPEIDMEEIVQYAKTKNVGIILWVIWKTFDEQLNEALDQFEKWGIKGVKIDFMQRDDQEMVKWYRHIAKKTADKKLIVDFHGAYKPAGLRRAYPNVLTREGVPGLEHSKWGTDANPDMAVTIPFIRMVAGPIDYTPGGMLNANADNFRPIFNRPMTLGTRCHQLAMYVVFESPLQMLADSPSNYYREQESLDFISKVPTVWDETKVLDGKIGHYVAVARKHREEWFVGILTGSTSTELEVDFSFLDKNKKYTLEIFEDGINADRYAADYKKTISQISSEDVRKIKLAPGGGWACRIYHKF